MRLSKWKKKSTDKSTDSETDNEEENNTEDINQTKKNKKKKKKRKRSDGEEEEEESDNLSDIDWGRPPPADYNASALLEAEKDMYYFSSCLHSPVLFLLCLSFSF